MHLTLLALLLAGATASPFNVHVELQDIIEASLPDSAASVLNQSFGGKSVDASLDPTSAVVTSIDPLEQTQEVCFWVGTAPFCSGDCPDGWDNKKSDKCGDGKCCTTGRKVQCCRTFNLNNCKWSGTAPLCQGACKQFEELEVRRDNCGDGECCAIGSKAKCCKPA